MCRVDVGDEEELEVTLRIRREGDVRHDGTEVRPADADVDDVLDALAGEALPLALADEIGEVAHLLEDGADGRHHVLAVHVDARLRIAVAQRRVQHGAVFGHVDLLAGEHLLDLSLEVRRLGELHERLHRLAVDAVLRIVEEPPCGGKRELLRPLRILRKEFLDRLLRGRDHRVVQIRPLVSIHWFHKFQVLSFRFLVSGFKLQVSGFRPRRS